MSSDDGDEGTVQTSAFEAEEADEYGDVLGRMREGESALQVGDEAWLCDSGASTRMTPSADCMIKLRIMQPETAHLRMFNTLNRRIW